jgi:hypothetical protein
MKFFIFVLFIVFLTMLYFLFFPSGFLMKTNYVTVFDDYLDRSLILTGHLELLKESCVLDKECKYDVVFIDDLSIFSNISLYKDDKEFNCFDEYSKEPRKYIGLVCGLKYIDTSINKEKFERINIDFSKSGAYNFTLKKNNSFYYLNLINILD